MENFCKKCGARLDAQTGLCPNCQSHKTAGNEKKGNDKKRRLQVFLLLIAAVVAMAVGVLIGSQIRGNRQTTLEKEAAISKDMVKKENTAGIESTQASGIQEDRTTPKAIVTDAYFDSVHLMHAGPLFSNNSEEEYTCYYHVPQVNLDLPGIEQVNKQIYDDLYHGILEKDVLSVSDPRLSRMAYFYTVKEDILSVLVCVYDRWSAEYYNDHQYYSYNVSMETGSLLSNEEMVNAFGLTFSGYQSMAQKVTKEMSDYFYLHNDAGVIMDDYYAECLEWTLSEENFRNNQLYIDPVSGDLCTTVRIRHVDGLGDQEYSFDVIGTEDSTDPATYRDISKKWDGTEETWRDLAKTGFEEVRGGWDIGTELPEAFFCITSSLRVGWDLMLEDDGSFKSTLKNPDWGDYGETYPNGTCYIAEKSGKFARLEKVNDTTYKMVVSEAGYTEQNGKTYIEDGTRYIVENESSIDSGDVFFLFLPGTPHSEFPQGLVDSVNNNGRYSMDDITPSSYVLYHPDAKIAGYELVFLSVPSKKS